MKILRSLLLQASLSPRLRRIVPRLRFVRRAVTRFMPGEDVVDALAAAESLARHGISTVLTHLGENLTTPVEATEVVSHYLAVLRQIHERKLDCHISVKPTQLGLDFSEDVCLAHLEQLVDRAKELGVFVWIDMESSTYVDRTLSLYERIRAKHEHVGVCLQSYLYRTEADLERLLAIGGSIRLVKGTYAEPPDIAMKSKHDVDESFHTLAIRLLRAAGHDGVRAGLGTHDVQLLRRIDETARREGIESPRYEIQMLYGIQRDAQLHFVGEGFAVRVLISYGTFWFPWYMRRLAERPANVLFVLRSIFSR